MGQPVRIAQLAEDMIRMSGLRPHDDIEIEYSAALHAALDAILGAARLGDAEGLVALLREAVPFATEGVVGPQQPLPPLVAVPAVAQEAVA
jgi:hypothetical protein